MHLPSFAAHRRRWLLGWAVLLMAVTLLPFGAVGAVAGTSEGSGSPEDAGSSEDATDPDPTTAAPLVIVGTTGVTWEDVSPEATPNLWEFAESHSSGNLIVRSVRSSTCPVDGWLALSAGARAADLPASERVTDVSGLSCRRLREAQDGVVPGWQDYQTAAVDSSFEPNLGLFGDLISEDGLTATAIGPGAAIALATTDGEVAGTAYPTPESPSELTALVAADDSDILVIDIGTISTYTTPTVPSGVSTPLPPDPEDYRSSQLAEIDAQFGAVLDGISQTDRDPVLAVAAVADSARSAAMHVLAVSNYPSATAPTGTLTSASTKQTGYLQSTDLLPTFLAVAGISDLPDDVATDLVGSPLEVSADGAAGADRIATLADANVHARAQQPIVSPFYLVLVVLNVALYAIVAFGLARPAPTRLGTALARLLHLDGQISSVGALRPTVLRGLRIVSVALAAIPVSTYLANFVPWWRAGVPWMAFVAVTAVIDAALVALALVPRWRRSILTPLGIIAGTTALVLALDVLTGSRLQISAIMGIKMLVAGRFYGFNNTAFSLFMTSMILVAVAITNPLVRRGRRWLAAGIVAVLGVVSAVLDGTPSIGADFGGPPAIIPAFAVLTLLAAGIRVTWKRALLILAAAATATAALAIADYLRPQDQQTHLGRFVATVLDGGAWDVVMRKLEANLRILANNRPLTILAITGIALVVFVLARPLRKAINSPSGGRYSWLSSGAPLAQMNDVTPMLGPGLVALAVGLGIGFAMNDSGIAIPAYGVSVAVPLLLAACASWMLSLKARPGESESEPHEAAETA